MAVSGFHASELASITEDYAGDDAAHQLTVEEGDVVQVLDESMSHTGFNWVKSMSTQQVGYVPVDILKRKKKPKPDQPTGPACPEFGTITEYQRGDDAASQLMVEEDDVVQILDESMSHTGFIWVKSMSTQQNGYVPVDKVKRKNKRKSVQPRAGTKNHNEDPNCLSDDSEHSTNSSQSIGYTVSSNDSRRSRSKKGANTPNGRKEDAKAPDESESLAKTIYSGYEANMGNLRTLLDQDGIRDLPIVVVPVAGEFRTGKSFLLSYFLRYLTNQDFGEDKEKLIGFDHANSDKPVTQGIKIWHEPLIVNAKKSNKKVLVLVMDSQGIFNRGDKDESTRIFALTTMISSMMIFNLKGQLNEAVLGQLKLFSAYAKEATTAEDTDGDAPFQKLTLLIRDWEKADPPYGLKGGKEYMDNYFLEEADEEFENYFEQVDCYLMPHPGRAVNIKGYDGSLRRLDGEFKTHMKRFITDFFDFDNLFDNRKEVAGDAITAGDFCDYFERCTKMLDNVDWNQPTNMLEMNASFKCEIAKKDALAVYTENMDKVTDSWKDKETDALLTEDQLMEKARKATDEANKKFEEMGSFARNNAKKIYKEGSQKLEKELGESYAKYKKKWDDENDNKKKELEQQNQTEAIDEAKKLFSVNLGKESTSYIDKESGAIITKMQLRVIHGLSITEAVEKFEEKCKKSGSNFPEMYTGNIEQLKKDLRETLPKYEDEWEQEKVKKMDQEQQNQLAAMEKAKEAYNERMEQDMKSYIEANENINDLKIENMNNIAINTAKEKYDEICLENGIFHNAACIENKKKLTEDLKDELVKYKQKMQTDKEKKEQVELEKKRLHDLDVQKKLQTDRDILMQSESENQIRAIREAKQIYIEHMEQNTTPFVIKTNHKEQSNRIFDHIFKNLKAYSTDDSTEAFMTEQDLQGINENAITLAMKKYEDISITNGTTLHDIFNQHRIQLVKDLKEELPTYRNRWDTERRDWVMKDTIRKMANRQDKAIQKIKKDYEDNSKAREGLDEKTIIKLKKEFQTKVDEIKTQSKTHKENMSKGKPATDKGDKQSKMENDDESSRKIKKKDRKEKSQAVGIDLGATKSYISVVLRNDSIETYEVEHDKPSDDEFVTETDPMKKIPSSTLRKLMTEAEKYWRGIDKKAVISVPAYFEDSLCEDIKETAKKSGIDILKIITKPMAAAIASGYVKKKYKNILIFDLGRRNFEVSILSKMNADFVVIATTPKINFGGQNFDDHMVDKFAKEFESRNDEVLDEEARSSLRGECEKAKISLSANDATVIDKKSLYKDIDYYTKITHKQFGVICSDLFSQIRPHVENALAEAKMDKSQIDEVIFVGRSTKMPKVEKIIQDMFDGNKLNTTKNGDEVFAMGAAVRAAEMIDY